MCDQHAGSHVLDEAERSLHDALCVLQQTVQDSRVIYGGGFPEMQMAKVSYNIPLTCFCYSFLIVPSAAKFDCRAALGHGWYRMLAVTVTSQLR